MTMEIEESPRLLLLRIFFILDAVLLLLIGGSLVLFPGRVEQVFHFQNLPLGVDYLIGLWGCVMATLGLGYALAAREPARNAAWVQIGIARGALECAFGAVCLGRGIVGWQQAGFGIVTAGLVALVYILLYPMKERRGG
ncbi:MAG TPA: hypothetical protein VG733_06715 [Chthoniobacteraceae bacterium]|nr:hypothetical protein [Chthoniobacteraceae bacterium]